MQRSYWSDSRIVLGVVAGLSLLACIREDATAVKPCDATCTSDGEKPTETVGGNSGAAGASGQVVPGTIGTDAGVGSYLGNCQLACDAAGSTCAGIMCGSKSDGADRIECEKQCLQSDLSCDATCASDYAVQGNTGDAAGCGLVCGATEPVCTGFCNAYSDTNIKKSCENHCIDNGKTCREQC